MTTTADIQVALANEARRQEKRLKIAALQGAMNATASAVQKLNSVNSDAQIMLGEAQAELAALEAGAGPGITADFGPKSVVTQLVESERFAAKDAVIAFVKANPECTEEDAAAQWDTAALASHPEFPLVIQDARAMSKLYRSHLLAGGLITDDSWEAQRQWILTTSTDVIQAL
jgi:hypothetical protein